MLANEYQELAYKTWNQSDQTRDQLIAGSMGLCGEAGEVIDHIKKYAYQGHEINEAHLLEELGDVFWYLALLCTAMDTTIEQVMIQNITKLKNLYPYGFESKRSINRER